VVATPDPAESGRTWPSEKEKEFELLLAETEYANKQITGYMDLQIRVNSFIFSALAAVVAALFAAQKSLEIPGPTAAKVLLVLSLIGSFGVLQTAITYGTSLTYIDRKQSVLGPRLQRLLGLSYQPLDTVPSFTDTGVSKAVLFAAYFSTVGVTLLNFGGLCYCVRLADGNCHLILAIGVGFVGVIGSFVAQVLTRRAMETVGLTKSTEKSSASR
jgi:hypothetical protein